MGGMSTPLVVAYGGGLNSTAMLIGLHQRGVRPDLILMANTGGERPDTLRFLGYFAAWLNKIRFPELIIVTKAGMDKTLEDECLRKSMLPSLAYGFKSCSLKWKVQPQDKYVNNWQPAKDCWASCGKVVKTIGYDAGEERRAKIESDDKYTYWYPLIEWGWDRTRCIEAVRESGLPIPPKSSCFFCPAMRVEEIRALREHDPELFDRAVAMEQNANLTSVKGLGRRFAWRDVASADDEQMRLFKDSVAADDPCGCYDGDYAELHQTVVELTTSAGCKQKQGEQLARDTLARADAVGEENP